MKSPSKEFVVYNLASLACLLGLIGVFSVFVNYLLPSANESLHLIAVLSQLLLEAQSGNIIFWSWLITVLFGLTFGCFVLYGWVLGFGINAYLGEHYPDMLRQLFPQGFLTIPVWGYFSLDFIKDLEHEDKELRILLNKSRFLMNTMKINLLIFAVSVMFLYLLIRKQ